jgi:hypothetical protein
MGEPNSISDLLKGREKVITYTPIVYNPETDFSQITNVLLVHSGVQDYTKFVENCNSSTFPITFSSSSKGQDIVDLLAAKLPTITRIAIVANNSLMSNTSTSKQLFSHKPYFLSSDLVEGATSYSENVQLLIDLIKAHEVKNIDFLACYSLTYDNWKGYYSVLAKKTGVIVGASNDETGNLAYGGDWTMESTNVDIEAMYFTSGISGYQGTLAAFLINFNCSLYMDGNNVAYSLNGSGDGKVPITWGPGCELRGTTTVTLGQDLIFNSVDNYFIISNDAGNNVTLNGAGYKITINNVANYPGLVSSLSNSTVVTNVGVVPNTGTTTTTLRIDGGWIGQGDYFSENKFIGRINNCYSTGANSDFCGGIVGAYAGSSGSCNISDCYSTGAISDFGGGGIAGDSAGSGGSCTIYNCYSTGAISGDECGGIAGASAGNGGNCTIYNCYSTGAISGEVDVPGQCGGIAGSGAGVNGNCTIYNCYSTGNISYLSGGIAGGGAGYSEDDNVSSRCTITNCYSSGTVDATSGGIAGSLAGSKIGSTNGICTLNNCYVTGTNTNTNKYFGANKGTDASTPTNNCGSSSGWSDAIASNVLVNTSGIWKRFVDNSGGVVTTIPWQIVTFLTSVTATYNGINIVYTSSGLPINPYPGTTISISDGTNSIDGEIDLSGKVATFVLTGETFLQTNLIYLNAYTDPTNPHTLNSFYVNTSQTTSIGSTTTMTRDDIYNYKYSYPITVTCLDIGEGFTIYTHVRLDNNVIVGNLQFIADGNGVIINNSYDLRTIQVNDVVDYPGLVYSRSNNTTVTNIGLLTSGSTTLAESGGWIGQGDPGGLNSFIGIISNCYSTGPISSYSGGIAGTGAGYGDGAICTISNCYSTGDIIGSGGGITGSYAGVGCTISNCYSTGDISDNSGGIAGTNGSCTISNCYSTGAISGGSGGGIVGGYAGTNGSCTITNCYSTGDIGGSGGGIVGGLCWY